MSKKGRRLLLAGVLTTVVVASLAIVVTGPPSVTVQPSLKTAWGEPDLQGIWTRDVDIPLERPAKYADQEFFSDAERRELDRQIADIIKRDSTEERRARGTERDVNRWRLRRRATPFDSSSSRSFSPLRRAETIIRAAPVESTVPFHPDETRRLRVTSAPVRTQASTVRMDPKTVRSASDA